MNNKSFGNGSQTFTMIFIIIALLFPNFSCINTEIRRDCNGAVSRVPKEDFLVNSNGYPVSWRSSDYPIPVIISPEFDSFERSVIEQSIEYWNNAVGETILVPMEGISNAKRIYSGYINITKHDLYKNCNNQLLGLATKTWGRERGVPVYIDGTRIEIHAGHAHDLTYFRTVVHEIGHALGLNHDESTESVMYPYIRDGEWIVEEEDINYIIESLWGLHYQ